MKKNRIYYFDNLKIVLIFLVVLGHFIERYINISYNTKVLWTFIYTFHMPLFIFISGYFAKRQIDMQDYIKTYKYLALFYIMQFMHFLLNKYIFGNNVNLNMLNIKNIEWYLFAMAIWPIISIKTKNINFNKKLIFSIIISLIIGYDPFFRDFLCLSRIIVFYPFFLIGSNFELKKVEKIKKRKNIIIAFILLTAILVFYYYNIDLIYQFRPILTGRNNYNKLNENIREYGMILRFLWYIFTAFISVLILIVIPRKKFFITKYGERTLSVYFWHSFIIYIFQFLNLSLHLYQYLLLSIITTCLLSSQLAFIPVKNIFKKL